MGIAGREGEKGEETEERRGRNRIAGETRGRTGSGKRRRCSENQLASNQMSGPASPKGPNACMSTVVLGILETFLIE